MIMEAKTIVKNKFWIVEDEGEKIATIQAVPDGVVLVKDFKREKFVDFKLLRDQYNIKITKPTKVPKPASNNHSIYGLPVNSKPHNITYDVRKRIPFFTKSNKSKSFFCAGYYVVYINNQWSMQFCPKNITINRYSYYGPYSTAVAATQKLNCLVNV
jgi:hypothetical protein